MITNISRQLTTGTLALAGTVAALSFAGAAPVQAQAAVCIPQSFSNFMSNPCRNGDKLFTYSNSSGTNVNSAFLAISETVLPSGDIHTFTYTPNSPLTSTSGVYTIDYTVEIVDNPSTPENETLTNMFSQFSAGYTTTSLTDFGVSMQKQVWSTNFGTGLIGTSTASSATSSVGNSVTVPTGITKLFVRDTFSVSNPNGSINSLTNDFRQVKKTLNVPEPSAILGILAVAGVGAFARRKS